MANVLGNETPKVAQATILRSGRLAPGPPRESAHPVRQATESSMSASMLHDISPRSPERYAVSGELMGELTTFLDNHLNALLRTQRAIQERGLPDIFSPGVSPNHQHEAALLRQLAPGGKIDEERVKVFLSTNEGKMATVVLLEDVAWKNLAVMNLRAEQTGAPPPRREDHLHLGFDRGVINTWITKHIDDLRTAGILSGPVATAVAVAAATGIWPIAAAGPVADAIITFARSFRGGATLRTRECEEIGNIIRQDRNEQIYFWNTYEVDMIDPANTAGQEKKREQLLETLYTRFQLLNELGFPPRDITALPDYILRRDQGVDNQGRPVTNRDAREQEDTLWRKQVIDEYNQLYETGVRVRGRALSRDEEIQLVFEAQANIVLRNAEVAFEEITTKESEGTLTRRHQEIKTRIESATDADFQKSLKKLRDARDVLTRLNGDGGLGGEDQKLVAYTQALKKLEVARARAFAQFGTADLVAVDKLVNGVTDERLGELRQQLFDAEKAVIDQRQASETIGSIFKSGQDSFTEITAVAVGGVVVGLTQDELTKLSFDALLGRINAAGLWQAADNADPQNRMRLMLAIAEAKSRKANLEIIPDANRAFDRITAVAGAPSENSLWAMTGNQLRKYFADNLLVWPVDALTGNPIDANRVIEQARGRFSTRFTYIQEIIHGENARTSRHNAIVGRETRERQQKITSLQELRQVILQNEAKMANIRDNGSELALETISGHFSTYQEASDFIARIDRSRKLAGDNSYDWANLAGLTPDLIMVKFNGLPGGLGWPAAENTRPDHMRTVALIKAEADARRQNPNVFSDNPALVELENLQVHEDDIRLALAARTSVEEFIRGKINNGSHPDWDASNKDTIAYVRSAFDQVAARQQLRGSKIQAVMEANPNYRESVARLNSEYVSLERDLIKKQTEAQGIMGGARPDAAQIRTAINTLETELRNFEEFAEIQGLDQLILQFNAFRTALSGLDNARNAIKQEVPGVSISTVSEMDAEMKKRKDQAETRNAIRNGLQNVEDEFAAASETTGAADRIVDQLVADFDAIRKIQTDLAGGAPPAPMLLTPAIFATGTLDQVVTAINALHVAGRAMAPPRLVGWPDNLNNKDDLRLRVANAIVEARAQVPPRSARLTQVIGVGLTESYLRSATPEAIAKRLNESGLGPVNLANPAARTAVSNLVLEARTAFNKRKASLEQMTGGNMAELLRIEGDIGQGEKGAQAAKESFQVVEGLLSKREIVYSNVEDISKNIGRFTDGTLLAAGIPIADNYRAAEIGMGLPVGMYEIYNLIFDYQTGKREENFERVMRVLPPDQLVTIFAGNLNLPGIPLAPPGVARQQAFLTALQNASLTDRALRRTIRSLMGYLAPREFGA